MRQFNYAKITSQLLSYPGLLRLLTEIHEANGALQMLAIANKKYLAGLKSTRPFLDLEAFSRVAQTGITSSRLKALTYGRVKAKDPAEQSALAFWKIISGFSEYQGDNNPPRLSEKLILSVDLLSVTAIESVGGNLGNDSDLTPDLRSLIALYTRRQKSDRYSKLLIGGMLDSFNDAVVETTVAPLLAIVCFVLDYRYVQREINGLRQEDHLLLMFLLNRYGFTCGTYVSLETLFEQRANQEEEAFTESAGKWQSGQCNSYLPYVKFLLETVLEAYREIISRVKPVIEDGLSRSDRILDYIGKFEEPVSKRSIVGALPDLSQKTIERYLDSLVKSESIRKYVSGREIKFCLITDNNNSLRPEKNDPKKIYGVLDENFRKTKDGGFNKTSEKTFPVNDPPNFLRKSGESGEDQE